MLNREPFFELWQDEEVLKALIVDVVRKRGQESTWQERREE